MTTGIEEKVRALAEPLLADKGMELVDLAFVTEHGRHVLRIFIDKPGGVNVDDCGEFSKEFSTILDVDDPIPQRYMLEVSSPGLDRPLVKEADFKRFVGKKAKIKAKEAIDGRRNFKAVIDNVVEGKVFVTDFDGKKFEIALSNIERARLEIEF